MWANVCSSQYRGAGRRVSGSTSLAVSEKRRWKLRRWACAVRLPQRRGEDRLLPRGDGVEVELEEDPFAAVLGRRHPGRLAVAGELDQPAGEVVDAVHLVEAGEPEHGVDLLHLVDGDDAADARVQVGAALHLGDHQPAGVLLLREQRRLLQVAPLGHEQLDRVPGGELLLAHLLGVGRCEHVGDRCGEVVVGDVRRGRCSWPRPALGSRRSGRRTAGPVRRRARRAAGRPALRSPRRRCGA